MRSIWIEGGGIGFVLLQSSIGVSTLRFSSEVPVELSTLLPKVGTQATSVRISARFLNYTDSSRCCFE